MNTRELLAMKPEELATKQRDELVAAVCGRLWQMAADIEVGDYAAAENMLKFSPAGDYAGCDNNYIAFDDVLEPELHNGTDIGHVIERLVRLDRIIGEA